jgi:predicted nucleotidyltransferase
MTTYKSREDLKTKIIQAFANEEEIYKIFFFGREVEKLADNYSDIDIVVCSKNLAQTGAKYKKLLGSISPIISTWIIESTSTTLSEMLMLEGYSPYQKIDFSIVNRIEDKTGFGPFVSVYESAGKIEFCPSELQVHQIQKDVAYKLDEVLFSIARFTKCLFRNDMDMYRRWKSMTDITLVMLYEKYFGWEKESRGGLRADEAKKLYEKVKGQERKALTKILPAWGQLDVASSYQASLNLFVELSKQKAKYFGKDLDSAFIGQMQSFLWAEIKRFQVQRAG